MVTFNRCAMGFLIVLLHVGSALLRVALGIGFSSDWVQTAHHVGAVVGSVLGNLQFVLEVVHFAFGDVTYFAASP